MTMKFRMGAALMALGLIAGTANAQSVDRRHADQRGRIAQGVRSGELTRGETHSIARQQHSIHHQESRIRYRNGGGLTAHNRAMLQHRENRASAHIYRAKHNGRVH